MEKRSTVGARPADVVTRDLVIASYRLLLGREPENEDVIRHHLRSTSRSALVRTLISSPEFLARDSAVHPSHQISRLRFPMSVEVDPPQPEQLTLLTERVSETWRRIGKTRPHWSVLSHEKYLPDNIGGVEDAFFASGAHDMQQLLQIIRHVGRRPDEFTHVMDFGCGLGRITNHLAGTFETVIGCDISASHLELARAHSAEIGRENITYLEISAPEFGMTSPIDLWFSVIVLQHNPPPVMAAILRRVFHMLNDGGLAVFQVPTYAPGYRFRVSEYLARRENEDGFEMYVLPQPAIFTIMREAGCHILEILEDYRTGGAGWLSNMFVVGK